MGRDWGRHFRQSPGVATASSEQDRSPIVRNGTDRVFGRAGPVSDAAGRPTRRTLAVTAVLTAFAIVTIGQYAATYWGSTFAAAYPILTWGVGALLLALPLALAVATAKRGLARIASLFAARDDSEHEQILIRVVLVFALMVYFHETIDPGSAPAGSIWAYWILSAGLCISWAFLLHIVCFPGRSVVRRVLAMNADLWINSLVMHVGAGLAAVMYPIYLWVTFGNGFRYGARYLVGSAAISLVGFGYVLWSTPYWQQTIGIGYGLLIALVCLPAYVVSLIRKLTEAKAAAEAASQAKSRFLATISHELRTPLNSIIGLTGLIKKSPLDSEQRSMVRSVRSSARTLLSLINNILDFSKLESGRLTAKDEPFDLYALIAEIESMFTVQARAKGLRFYVYVDPAVPPGLVGDPDHLRDVIVNLVGNGLKFTETGLVGVEVRTRPGGHDRVEVELKVRDTGIGIPEEKWETIFDSFSQADDTITRRYGGTGLGLSIVRQLVAAMGGTIGVSSEPGRGSVFAVHLPFGTHASVDYRVSAGDRDPVFIVTEDEAVYERIAAEVLRRRGRPVAVAGATRLSAAVQGAAGANRPIVLYDARSGQLTGREFARIVKAQIKRSPPILCLIRDAEEGGEGEERDYLSILKAPVDPDALANMLHVAGYVAGGVASISARPVAPTGPRRALTILLAEDNLVNRRVVSKILESAGHAVVAVENGEEALSALDDGSFDLVLMDLNMPEMSGPEAAKLYRFASTDKPHLPIIALTADATPEGRKRSEEAGMDDYVIKPVEPDDLLRIVDRWAAGESGQQAAPSAPSGGVPDGRAPAGATRAVREGGRERSGAEVADIGNVRRLRPAEEAPRPPIVDPSALEALRALGDGEEFVAMLAEDFLADSAETVNRIVDAVNSCDARGVRDGAHALRSSAAHFGARRLHGVCISVSGVTVGELMERGAALAAELHREFELVRVELARLLGPAPVVAAGE